MAFEAITAPNNRTHWIDREKASQWLQRTIDLSNPETTPGLSSPVFARDVLTRSGWNRQLEGIKAAWNALHHYYLAINIPARSEPTYREEFEIAYGKQINWSLISAYGPFSSGSLTQRAGDAVAGAGVSPLPTSTRFLIRVFITTDGKEYKIYCPRGTFCVGPNDTRIKTTGSSRTFSDCNTVDDWRCTYWGTDVTSIVMPPLVGSMDLAYAIASRLQKSEPDVIARYAIAVAGNPLEIWPLWNSEAYRAGKELPSPPVRGSREDILTDPIAAPPGMLPPAVTPPPPTPPTVSTDPRPIIPDVLRGIKLPTRDLGSLSGNTTTTSPVAPVTQPVSMPVMPTMPTVPRPTTPPRTPTMPPSPTPTPPTMPPSPPSPPPMDPDHTPHRPPTRRPAPRIILMPQRVSLGVSCAQWNALDLTQKMQVAEATLIQQYGVVPMDQVAALIAQMDQACVPTTSTMPSTTSADTAPTTTSAAPAPSQSSSEAWWLLGAAALITVTVWWSNQTETRAARHRVVA